MQNVQIVGVVASLISCLFWIAGAGIRFRPVSLFRLSGPDSIPAALQRQSLLNAFAAVFASIAAGAQAIMFYAGI
jgi:hypothetical protein